MFWLLFYVSEDYYFSDGVIYYLFKCIFLSKTTFLKIRFPSSVLLHHIFEINENRWRNNALLKLGKFQEESKHQIKQWAWSEIIPPLFYAKTLKNYPPLPLNNRVMSNFECYSFKKFKKMKMKMKKRVTSISFNRNY